MFYNKIYFIFTFVNRNTMAHKFQVKTETKGVLTFNELPKDVYWGGGFQDPADKDKAFWYGWDRGTCLIPFTTAAGEFVYKGKNDK